MYLEQSKYLTYDSSHANLPCTPLDYTSHLELSGRLAANETSSTMSNTPEQKPLSFGTNYAVLNLDWMTLLIDAVRDTKEGQSFIANCRRWNDVVHALNPPPMTIFSRLHFSHGEQELASSGPFTKLIRGYGSFTTGSPAVQIAPDFKMEEGDSYLQKTRWFAGAGNGLVQMLRARKIDTVLIVRPHLAENARVHEVLLLFLWPCRA